MWKVQAAPKHSMKFHAPVFAKLKITQQISTDIYIYFSKQKNADKISYSPLS